MPIQEIGLAASLLAGALFLLASLRPGRAEPPEPMPADGGIYWPVLLGTGQRHFDRTMRLAIVAQLAQADKDWRLPILLCAREQETDPAMLDAIARALGDAAVPVIGA